VAAPLMRRCLRRLVAVDVLIKPSLTPFSVVRGVSHGDGVKSTTSGLRRAKDDRSASDEPSPRSGTRTRNIESRPSGSVTADLSPCFTSVPTHAANKLER
jgi:hypothetical protein